MDVFWGEHRVLEKISALGQPVPPQQCPELFALSEGWELGVIPPVVGQPRAGPSLGCSLRCCVLRVNQWPVASFSPHTPITAHGACLEVLQLPKSDSSGVRMFPSPWLCSETFQMAFWQFPS